MAQLEVKSTGPLQDIKRLECLKSVNNLSDKQIKNLTELVNSPSAKQYLESDVKFALLKRFI